MKSRGLYLLAIGMLWICMAISSAAAAPMTDTQVSELGKIYADQLIDVPKVKGKQEVPRNAYVVKLVNRLNELGFYPGELMRNGRHDNKAGLTDSQIAAVDYYAQVAGLPHVWGVIEPLTFVYLMDTEVKRVNPTAILLPSKHLSIDTRTMKEGYYVNVPLTVQSVEKNGDLRRYTGSLKGTEWQCTLISAPSELEPEMIVGDNVFSFGKISQINKEAHSVVISAELVAFQAD